MTRVEPTVEAGTTIARVAVLSVHTSPLAQPGTGDGGGLNVYVRETARRLAARGVEVDVFTRVTAPGLAPVVDVTNGYRVHHVVAGGAQPVEKGELPSLLCSFLLALERHAGEHVDPQGMAAFDVLHAHYWLSGWVGRRLQRRWGIPLVQSFHTLGRVKNAALAPGDVPEPPLRLVAEARLVDEADRIIVPVCDEARLLHRAHGTSGARLSVVQPGVDLAIFHPERPGVDVGRRPPPDIDALPDTDPWSAATGHPVQSPAEAPPGDGPLLLFVGRLQPLKGPDIAVRTLAHVRTEVPDARLLVIGGESGSGNGRSGPRELARLATELGVDDAVGFGPARPQDVLADLYRAAAVVLVPSRSESFGLVALEAQACGTPVVAADVGGLRAVVRRGGTLVGGHDPADHAAAVLPYLTDSGRREHAGALAAREASAFTWERTVSGLLDVYESVARRPSLRSTGA